MNSFLKYFTYPEFRNLKAMDDMYNKALMIVNRVFEGIVDKGGNPYINHLYFVRDNVDDINEKIVALLHDLVEDTEIVVDELYDLGFSDDIIEAILLITRKENESYNDFIERIIKSGNLIALRVKVADMKNNMDISRIPKPTKKDYERIKNKYEPNYKRLVYKLEERMKTC